MWLFLLVNMKKLILIVLILAAVQAPSWAGQKVTADTDKDGRIDQTAFYDSRGRLLRLEVDQNRDGRTDRIQHYENQVLVRGERDIDHDGRMDCTDLYEAGKLVRQVRTDAQGRTCQIIYFDGSEKIRRIEKDSSGDGKFDLFYYFEDGVLARSEKDTTGSGRINIRQLWAHDMPVELTEDRDEDGQNERIIWFGPDGLPEKSRHDLDGDGETETLRTYEQGKLVLENRDTNLDSHFDRITRFEKELPVHQTQDRNHDRAVDYTALFDSQGHVEKIIEDSDFDGRVDRIRWFSKGNPLHTDHDSDRDGFLETRSFYTSGRLARQTRDLNRDKKPDQWTWFGPAGERTRIEADTDFNGRVETWHFFEKNLRVRLEKDETGNGRPDLKVLYRDEKQVRLVRDRDGDGCFEMTREFGVDGFDRRDSLDRDCDGRPETRSWFAGEVLRVREADENLDGEMDFREEFSPEGRLVRAVESHGRDARLNLAWIYDEDEVAVRGELDTDRDSRADTWFYYDEGLLSRVAEDTNRDGKPDLWETYDRSERMVLEEKDIDFDGICDLSRAWNYEGRGKEAQIQ